jgi:hypothetical protein
MGRVLFISFTGVLIGGCAGADAIRPPTEPTRVASAVVSTNAADATARLNATVILDDAIDRLIPALGRQGAALGAPLRRLRGGGRLDAGLIDATQEHLAAFRSSLPAESSPDADALEIALIALRSAAAK